MKYFLSLIVVLFIIGCQDVQRPQRPDDLISKDKIIDIYTEAYMMNAARSINLKVINENGVYLDSTLYKKFNIDSMQFVRSNAFYTSNLNEYLSIFEEVKVRLTLLDKKEDSIKFSEVDKAERALMKDSTNRKSGKIPPVKSDSN